MTRDEHLQRLRREIESRLAGRIDRDYVLMGLPYYLNVGDILIWEGTRQYLETFPFRCLNPGYRYREENRIGADTLILLQGGGNFGDLWRWIQEERLDILRRHPRNPALIFPVSCCYEDPDLMRRDAEELAAHPQLTICARDQASHDLLVRHFRNRIVLVPDMAFFMNPAPLRKWTRTPGRGLLYLKRTDKELVAGRERVPVAPPDGLTVADWPSLERAPWHWRTYEKLLGWGRAARCRHGLWRFSDGVVQASDWFYQQIGRPLLVRQGAAFLGGFREILTTRLHAAILAVLMGMDVRVVDNRDGKISAFLRTWLADVDGVTLLDR